MKTFASDQNETRTFGFWAAKEPHPSQLYTDAALTKPALNPLTGNFAQNIVIGPPQLDYPWQIQNIFSNWSIPAIKPSEARTAFDVLEKFEITKRNVSPVQRTNYPGGQVVYNGGLSQLQFYPTILRERQQIEYYIEVSIPGIVEFNQGLVLEGQFSINYSIQQL